MTLNLDSILQYRVSQHQELEYTLFMQCIPCIWPERFTTVLPNHDKRPIWHSLPVPFPTIPYSCLYYTCNFFYVEFKITTSWILLTLIEHKNPQQYVNGTVGRDTGDLSVGSFCRGRAEKPVRRPTECTLCAWFEGLHFITVNLC